MFVGLHDGPWGDPQPSALRDLAGELRLSLRMAFYARRRAGHEPEWQSRALVALSAPHSRLDHEARRLATGNAVSAGSRPSGNVPRLPPIAGEIRLARRS